MTPTAASGSNKFTCFRCSKTGHKADDSNCSALGKTCSVCKKERHFKGSKYCRKKNKQSAAKIVSEQPQTESTSAVDSFSHEFTVKNASSYKTPKCNAVIGG